MCTSNLFFCEVNSRQHSYVHLNIPVQRWNSSCPSRYEGSSAASNGEAFDFTMGRSTLFSLSALIGPHETKYRPSFDCHLFPPFVALIEYERNLFYPIIQLSINCSDLELGLDCFCNICLTLQGTVVFAQ